MAFDVDAVVFDLDDTLIDWQSTERAAMDAVCQGHLPGIDPAHVHACYGEIKRRNFQAFIDHGTWSYVGERIQALLTQLQVEEDPELLEKTFTGCVRQNLRLLPGAADLLRHARTGRRTGLLTNGPAHVQRPKVDVLELAAAVDHVGIAGEMDLWKPDARAFVAVLGALDARPERTLMVGDSLHFDIRPARALGMKTCWVGGDDPREADLVLTDAAGLAGHLRLERAKSS